jgi:hypothetical protein
VKVENGEVQLPDSDSSSGNIPDKSPSHDQKGIKASKMLGRAQFLSCIANKGLSILC